MSTSPVGWRRPTSDRETLTGERGMLDLPLSQRLCRIRLGQQTGWQTGRKWVYGPTPEDVHAKWVKLQARAMAGPVPTKTPTVADAKRPTNKQRCCALGRCCQQTPSANTIGDLRKVLRLALSHAMTEDLITRNVAPLVKLPAVRRARDRHGPRRRHVGSSNRLGMTTTRSTPRTFRSLCSDSIRVRYSGSPGTG